MTGGRGQRQEHLTSDDLVAYASPVAADRSRKPSSKAGRSEDRAQPTYTGGCHCGRVGFEVTGRLTRVSNCNCSICSKKGYLHWIVPRDAFRLLTPAHALATYTFNTGVAQHHFCKVCGIASFYIPRSDPDKIDVNARCLDGVNLDRMRVDKFDGRNWEAAYQRYAAAPTGRSQPRADTLSRRARRKAGERLSVSQRFKKE